MFLKERDFVYFPETSLKCAYNFVKVEMQFYFFGEICVHILDSRLIELAQLTCYDWNKKWENAWKHDKPTIFLSFNNCLHILKTGYFNAT